MCIHTHKKISDLFRVNLLCLIFMGIFFLSDRIFSHVMLHLQSHSPTRSGQSSIQPNILSPFVVNQILLGNSQGMKDLFVTLSCTQRYTAPEVGPTVCWSAHPELLKHVATAVPKMAADVFCTHQAATISGFHPHLVSMRNSPAKGLCDIAAALEPVQN